MRTAIVCWLGVMAIGGCQSVVDESPIHTEREPDTKQRILQTIQRNIEKVGLPSSSGVIEALDLEQFNPEYCGGGWTGHYISRNVYCFPGVEGETLVVTTTCCKICNGAVCETSEELPDPSVAFAGQTFKIHHEHVKPPPNSAQPQNSTSMRNRLNVSGEPGQR